MRIDTQDRIQSLSFERDPKEHIEIMVAAGRRLVQPRRKLPRAVTFIGWIMGGVATGISADFYRELVLEPAFGMGKMPPPGLTALQGLPFFVMLAIIYYIYCIRAAKQRRQLLIERIGPASFIDIDIFEDGIRTSSAFTTTLVDWRAVRAIAVIQDRVEFELDMSTGYIPARAFKGAAEFEAAVQQMRRLWSNANAQHPAAESP